MAEKKEVNFVAQTPPPTVTGTGIKTPPPTTVIGTGIETPPPTGVEVENEALGIQTAKVKSPAPAALGDEVIEQWKIVTEGIVSKSGEMKRKQEEATATKGEIQLGVLSVIAELAAAGTKK